MAGRSWVRYGVAGAVGLTLIGGVAAATAASMDLRVPGGTVVPGGPLVGGGDRLDADPLELRVTGSAASVASAPTMVAGSPAEAPAPEQVAPPAPVSPPPPVDVDSDSGWSGSAWSD